MKNKLSDIKAMMNSKKDNSKWDGFDYETDPNCYSNLNLLELYTLKMELLKLKTAPLPNTAPTSINLMFKEATNTSCINLDAGIVKRIIDPEENRLERNSMLKIFSCIDKGIQERLKTIDGQMYNNNNVFQPAWYPPYLASIISTTFCAAGAFLGWTTAYLLDTPNLAQLLTCSGGIIGGGIIPISIPIAGYIYTNYKDDLVGYANIKWEDTKEKFTSFVEMVKKEWKPEQISIYPHNM